MPLWLTQQFPRAAGKKLSPLSHIVTVGPSRHDVRGPQCIRRFVPGGHPRGSSQGTGSPSCIAGDTAFRPSKFRESKEPWWGIQA